MEKKKWKRKNGKEKRMGRFFFFSIVNDFLGGSRTVHLQVFYGIGPAENTLEFMQCKSHAKVPLRTQTCMLVDMERNVLDTVAECSNGNLWNLFHYSTSWFGPE